MRKAKKENSVRRIVSGNHEEITSLKKGRNLMPAQHRAERNCQICLRIVCALHADGLLTVKELAAVKKHLLKKYDSIIGTLYEETEDGDKS